MRHCGFVRSRSAKRAVAARGAGAGGAAGGVAAGKSGDRLDADRKGWRSSITSAALARLYCLSVIDV